MTLKLKKYISKLMEKEEKNCKQLQQEDLEEAMNATAYVPNIK